MESDESGADFRRPLCVSLLLVAAMLLASVAMWLSLPEGAQLPVHWGIDGEPDRFGSKMEAGLVLPGTALFATLVFWVVPRIEPRKTHLLQSSKPYRALWYALIGLLAALHVNAMLLAIGSGLDMLTLTVALIALLFLILGNYLGKVRSTFLFGIRTPWTLSSDRVWDRTHRLGGRLFMGMAILSLLALLIGQQAAALIALVGGSLGSALFLTGYSWWLWRQEERQS